MQPRQIDRRPIVRAGPQAELQANRLLVGPLHVVDIVNHVGDGAVGLAVLVGDARRENIVDQLDVLHDGGPHRAEPATFEPEPPRVAVERGLVVVDQDRADQRVGSLQRRLRAAQDLHGAGVEERRLQKVPRGRAEGGLVHQYGRERVGVGVGRRDAGVVDPADAVGTQRRRARERVGGPVEGVLDREDGLDLDPLGAEVRDARAELLAPRIELAPDDGHVLGEAGELHHGIQGRTVGPGDGNTAPLLGLEAGQRE